MDKKDNQRMVNLYALKMDRKTGEGLNDRT